MQCVSLRQTARNGEQPLHACTAVGGGVPGDPQGKPFPTNWEGVSGPSNAPTILAASLPTPSIQPQTKPSIGATTLLAQRSAAVSPGQASQLRLDLLTAWAGRARSVRYAQRPLHNVRNTKHSSPHSVLPACKLRGRGAREVQSSEGGARGRSGSIPKGAAGHDSRLLLGDIPRGGLAVQAIQQRALLRGRP